MHRNSLGGVFHFMKSLLLPHVKVHSSRLGLEHVFWPRFLGRLPKRRPMAGLLHFFQPLKAGVRPPFHQVKVVLSKFHEPLRISKDRNFCPILDARGIIQTEVGLVEAQRVVLLLRLLFDLELDLVLVGCWLMPG